MPLTVYKSSAGSGKTYTLAREYIKLALRAPDYYQKILAVTFTNRAAEEMKERVLDFLMAIAKGKHELIAVYADELDTSEEQIIKRANASLTHLLHHYGYFNITTIDTFFHGVIRAFSREIGLQGNFGIELDTEKVADFITSGIFEGVSEDPQLKQWLVDFSMEGLMAGDGYEIRGQIDKLARQLFQEEFKQLPQEQFIASEAKEEIRVLKERLFTIKNTFEKDLQEIATSFDQALAEAHLSIDDLVYKGSGPGGFFQKLHRSEFDTLLTKRVEAAR